MTDMYTTQHALTVDSLRDNQGHLMPQTEYRRPRPDRTYPLAYTSTAAHLVEAGDASTQMSAWSILGQNWTNSNNGKLYWLIFDTTDAVEDDRYQVRLYNTAAKLAAAAVLLADDPATLDEDTTHVAKGFRATVNGAVTLTAANISGLSGSVTIAYTTDDADAVNILTVPLLETGLIELYATTNCFVRWVDTGETAAATTADYPMLAGEKRRFSCNGAHRLSVIRSTVDGTIYVTELE